VLGNGAFLAVALAGAEYGGRTLFAKGSDPEELQLKKEEARKRFRRPINETINEIGEGRGRLASTTTSLVRRAC